MRTLLATVPGDRASVVPDLEIARSPYTVGTANPSRDVFPAARRRVTAVPRLLIARLTTPALLLLLPACFFLALFHPSILQTDNAGWLIRGTDNGENALGAHAYWHDKMASSSLKTALLNAPEGVPVLYTDSNPFVTLAAKPFERLLPADAQLVGPFILFCLVLQAIFAWLLLRRHAPGAVALWAGVALLAFPPTLANRYIHANLMAHWTVLAALYLFLDVQRRHKQAWWMSLIAVTALIHSYLLVMVGSIWGSAMLVRFVDGSMRTRLVVLCQGAVVLALVVALGSWLGVGGQVSTDTFGMFAMPLDALWNPGNPTFSRLLPKQPSNTGPWFEGFQYLGAGGLLLVAMAIAVARKKSAHENEQAARQRLRGLVPALIVLGVLAIINFPTPPVALKLLDPVRAAGRLFWPVGYVLVFMAILAVYRLSAERASLALVGMVALQIVDLGGMAHAIRVQTEAADQHQLYRRTLDPRWNDLVSEARSVAFMPKDVTRDLGLFQEIAWRAINAERPLTNVYAARTGRDTMRRLDAEAALFRRGKLDRSRLYVLLPGTAPPAAAASRVLTLDGVTVIAPARAP